MTSAGAIIPGSSSDRRAANHILFRSYYVLALTFLIGTILSIALFQFIIRNNMRELQREFKDNIAQQSALLNKERRSFSQFLEDVQSFFAASEKVTREEFLYFTNFVLSQNKVILMAWVPAENIGAAARPSYMSYRMENSATADMLFNTEAIQKAIREAKEEPVFETSSVFPFQLSESEGSEPLIGLAVPTYPYLWHDGTEGLKQATGFIIAIFRIKPFVTEMESIGQDGYKNYYVYLSGRNSESKQLVFQHPESAPAAPALKSGDINGLFPIVGIITTTIGSRELNIAVTPSSHFLSRAADLTAWIVLLLGLVLTAAIAVFLQFILARNLQIRETVHRRTRELRHSEERQEAILKNIADGVLTMDAEGTIGMFNPACEHMFGYSETDVAGKNIRMLISEPGGADIGKFPEESSMLVIANEKKARRADGSEFLTEMSVGLIEDHDMPHQYVGVIRDITARKEIEDDLKNINQALDDFVYIVSHDLREPLRSIQNFSAILMEDCGESLDEEGKEHLETLGKVSVRMQEQLESLLHYSRASHKDFALENVSVKDVVEEVIQLLSALIQDQRAHIAIKCETTMVRCDRSCLVEVFTNLIQNAVKYRKDSEDPVIEVGCLSDVRDLPDPPEEIVGPVLYVRDNGIGIREEHTKIIFKMFKRLHARGQYGGGTGSGLAIVRKLVERHGGVIWVDSRPGEGSVFYFTMQDGARP
jgi:PAS domain S-box-containing protein